MKRALMLFLILMVLAVFFPAIAGAEETAFDVLVGKTEKEERDTALDEALRFYQENISSHDGARCLFYPTCSQFAVQALKKYGVFIGVLMTIDRMVYREDPLSMRYYSYDGRKKRYLDPVYHNNIFNEADYLK
jgi:putative membrane protein insertion efficiency factor